MSRTAVESGSEGNFECGAPREDGKPCEFPVAVEGVRCAHHRNIPDWILEIDL